MMTDLLLTAGLPAIDENLERVLDALSGYSIGSFGSITGMATGWAWLFLFIMISWEFIKMIGLNYQWSLAKLFRPFAFVFLLSFYGLFADAIMAPGNSLKYAGRGMAMVQNKMVEKEQKKVDSLATKYRNVLVRKITMYRSIEKAMAQQRTAERQLEEEKSLLGILESIGGATLSATVGSAAGPVGSIAGAVSNPVKGAIEEIRKLDPNHIFTKERGFAPGDPRRCRGHRFGPREGFHQMEKEYRILGFVANALEERKDVEIEEKKPVSVDEFKKVMNECLDKKE